MAQAPEFKYAPMFQVGEDTTEYYHLTSEHVSLGNSEGKEILKSLGIEGDYEGIGHCVLGYAAAELPAAKPRKENYVYYVEA